MTMVYTTRSWKQCHQRPRQVTTWVVTGTTSYLTSVMSGWMGNISEVTSSSTTTRPAACVGSCVPGYTGRCAALCCLIAGHRAVCCPAIQEVKSGIQIAEKNPEESSTGDGGKLVRQKKCNTRITRLCNRLKLSAKTTTVTVILVLSF